MKLWTAFTSQRGAVRSASLGIPSLEGFLYIWIGEERETGVALDRSNHDALHVGALYDLDCGDFNLRTEAGGVANGRAEDDAVKTRPQRAAHAHRAGFASGVERV